MAVNNASQPYWGFRPSEALSQPRSMTIDEQRVINALEAHVTEADTIQGSEISEQRQRNHVYYAGDRIGDERQGRSDHVSMDVLDSVESQKAYYREAFSHGRRPIRFKPENRSDQTAGVATEYVMDQFFEINRGHRFIRDSLHDAFVAKRCVAKVEWMEDYEEEILELSLPHQQVMAVSMDPSVIHVETVRVNQQNGTIDVIITREIDVSHSELELVQPERFYRDPNVSYIEDAVFAGFQEDIPRYELVDEGYDPEEVAGLKLDYRFRQNEEDAARKAHDASWSRQRRFKRPPEEEIVTVYTHYAWMDMSQYDSDFDPHAEYETIEDTRLYKFVWSQGKLLTLPETMDDETGEGERWIEVKDGMPFQEWTQYKLSHSEFGLCESDLQSEVQYTKSNLRRLIIDNCAMANTSRWKAKHKNVKNPRELLDNNIGATLWVNDMNGLEPLETPPISQASWQILETMDVEKENRNGLSRLAKGMNTDAISHQNAADMIQRLTNASNRRTMQGVRDFAEDYLKQIMLRMYMLGQKYDTAPRDIEIQGQMTQVQMTQMPKRKRIHLQAALTPDEGREQGFTRLQLHEVMKSDPEIGEMYGPMERYNNMTAIMDMLDVENGHQIIMSPASPQYKQRQEAKAKQMQEQKQMMMLELQLRKSDDERQWFDSRTKAADTATDNLLEDEKFQWEKITDAAEYDIERAQQRAAAIG